MVCSMTRRPANPISAPGSAMMISPWNAKLAATPPVVGFDERSGVEHHRQPVGRGEPVVVATSRADPEVPLQLFAVHEGGAPGTLRPQPGRDIPAFHRGIFWPAEPIQHRGKAPVALRRRLGAVTGSIIPYDSRGRQTV